MILARLGFPCLSLLLSGASVWAVDVGDLPAIKGGITPKEAVVKGYDPGPMKKLDYAPTTFLWQERVDVKKGDSYNNPDTITWHFKDGKLFEVESTWRANANWRDQVKKLHDQYGKPSSSANGQSLDDVGVKPESSFFEAFNDDRIIITATTVAERPLKKDKPVLFVRFTKKYRFP